jgi:hypothetical protein
MFHLGIAHNFNKTKVTDNYHTLQADLDCQFQRLGLGFGLGLGLGCLRCLGCVFYGLGHLGGVEHQVDVVVLVETVG